MSSEAPGLNPENPDDLKAMGLSKEDLEVPGQVTEPKEKDVSDKAEPASQAPDLTAAQKSIFHEPKSAVRVTGEIVDIGGVNEEPDWFPFVKQGVEAASPTFSVVGVAEGEAIEGGSGAVKLAKTSPEHGRSYEIDLGAGMIWADRYGDLYGSLGIKGNNLEDAHVERDQYSPTDFKVFGLQDAALLDIAIENSQKLREAGVETEKTELVIRPSEFVVGGRRMSVEEFRAHLYQRAETYLKERQKPSVLERDPLRPEDLPDIKNYLKNTEFYFSVRSLQVAERFRDLDRVKNEDDFKRIMTKVFTFANLREKIEAGRDRRDPQTFDVNKPEDVERYFTEYLPARLATNVARLHKAGFYHGFLGSHNLSLVGSVYDLDSVNYQQTGEEKSGVEKDFQQLVDELSHTLTGASLGLVFSDKSWFAENIGPRVAAEFFQSFTRTYLEQRGIEGLFGKKNLSEMFDSLAQSMVDDGAEELAGTIKAGETTFDAWLADAEKEQVEQDGEFNTVKELKDLLAIDIRSKLQYVFGYSGPDIDLSETIHKTASEWLEAKVDQYVEEREITHEGFLTTLKEATEAKLTEGSKA